MTFPRYTFRNLPLARSFALRASRPMFVILGDHRTGELWVVGAGTAKRLVAAGYEIVR
jgi:hypothetical protein